jgi:hypothetical protein
MVMTVTPDNSVQPYIVQRPMWFLGRVCGVGDMLHLPRSAAVEMQAAGKVRRAEAADLQSAPAAAQDAPAQPPELDAPAAPVRRKRPPAEVMP